MRSARPSLPSEGLGRYADRNRTSSCRRRGPSRGHEPDWRIVGALRGVRVMIDLAFTASTLGTWSRIGSPGAWTRLGSLDARSLCHHRFWTTLYCTSIDQPPTGFAYWLA